jgi:hypothetical protein
MFFKVVLSSECSFSSKLSDLVVKLGLEAFNLVILGRGLSLVMIFYLFLPIGGAELTFEGPNAFFVVGYDRIIDDS